MGENKENETADGQHGQLDIGQDVDTSNLVIGKHNKTTTSRTDAGAVVNVYSQPDPSAPRNRRRIMPDEAQELRQLYLKLVEAQTALATAMSELKGAVATNNALTTQQITTMQSQLNEMRHPTPPPPAPPPPLPWTAYAIVTLLTIIAAVMIWAVFFGGSVR